MTEKKIKRAIISVTDKEGADAFAQGLVRHGVEILSTGGTAALLKEKGIPVTDVSAVTRFPEIMDGRVKTLHPAIYGGLLARRDDEKHLSQMKEHGMEAIDLVAVNLYAFTKKTAQEGSSPEEAMEHVDIGGPCMIRAAAKNHEHVAVVIDPLDYDGILREMDERGGALSLETRKELAVKAFELTSSYDAAIHTYLRERASREALPQRFTAPSAKAVSLRYGENPHQAAAFYPMEGAKEPSVSKARQLGGKQLSYNNLLDTDAAFELVKEFEEPAAVIVKHTNPCGAALGADIKEAFEKAYTGDPLSAFGGIAALNRPVDEELARMIADPNRFLEVLIAPECPEEALAVLRKRVKWGKNLRVLCTGPLERPSKGITFRSITGGILVQHRDQGFEREAWEVKTEVQPDEEAMASLRFAWRVVKHVRSNAIVLARERAIVGVGAGQMSRIDSTHIAGVKAKDRSRGSVMASDAFFPFRDCVDMAHELGVKAIVQPGGSVRDKESVDAANEHGIALLFTGVRHFKH